MYFHSSFQTFQITAANNQLVRSIIPLLDGHHSLDQIVSDLKHSEARVVRALVFMLMNSGIVVESQAISETREVVDETSTRDRRAQFLDELHLNGGYPDSQLRHALCWGKSHQERLTKSHIAVIGCGRLGSGIVRSLVALGIGQITCIGKGVVSEEDIQGDSWFNADNLGWTRHDALSHLVQRSHVKARYVPIEAEADAPHRLSKSIATSDVVVVALDSQNSNNMLLINEICMDLEVIWTYYREYGTHILVGPTILAGESACFMCLHLRHRGAFGDSNRYDAIQLGIDSGVVDYGFMPVTPGPALAAVEVARIVGGLYSATLLNRVFSLDLASLVAESHSVLRQPRCPHCSRASLMLPPRDPWAMQGGLPLGQTTKPS